MYIYVYIYIYIYIHMYSGLRRRATVDGARSPDPASTDQKCTSRRRENMVGVNMVLAYVLKMQTWTIEILWYRVF